MEDIKAFKEGEEMGLLDFIILFEAFKKSMDSLPGDTAIQLAKAILSLDNVNVHQGINEYFRKYPITVKSIDEMQDNELEVLGLNRQYLKYNFIDEWAHEQVMSNSSFSTERYQYMFPQKQGSPPLYNTYVYATLEQGIFRAICPKSGHVLETSISFPVYLEELGTHFIFYRVEGREDFYIATAGYANLKSFLYLPKHNVVIVSPLYFQLGYPTKYVISAISQLYRKFLIFTEKTISFLQKPARNLALLYGMQTNLGHFFLNEYSGFYRIIMTGLYKKVQNIVIYKNNKIPLYQLFPEFNKAACYSCDNADELFETCMTHGLFSLYPCVSHLSADAAFHIQQAAKSYCSGSQKRLLADCVADPLIFINLRKHNKAWLEQVDGIINLARALKQNYPNVGIFLDGLSDCQEDAELINHALHKDIVVYNGVNISLLDTICWACRTDAYLCVIGSGLVLLTCIANKPGIVHSEHNHMWQVRAGGFWSGLRNDIFAPIVVSEDEVVVLKEEGAPTTSYEKYSMDWHSLYNRLIKILYPSSWIK
ncbi:hypothetical protein [Sporomusa sp. KB1]|uniref:hypothetical protein n=1 Tax=Sporomusa sp. KB1 TaxID=943346 RepID=UPI00119D5075|nr:hypothetical protein [Sporomusa sp. KB1]TWH46004.1 hypothetical protein Salpa_1942 [Sporomusa sp. KB1]